MSARERIAAAVARVAAGEGTIEMVARKAGMTTDVLKKACKQAAVVEVGGRPYATTEQKERAVRLVRRGATHGEAAAEVGVSRDAVSGAVRLSRTRRCGVECAPQAWPEVERDLDST